MTFIDGCNISLCIEWEKFPKPREHVVHKYLCQYMCGICQMLFSFFHKNFFLQLFEGKMEQ